MNRLVTIMLTALIGLASVAHGAEVHVAVVANFTGPMEKIVSEFERATGHKAVISYGTVGKFCSQIKNDASFAVHFSADHDTSKRLGKTARLPIRAVLLTRSAIPPVRCC